MQYSFQNLSRACLQILHKTTADQSTTSRREICAMPPCSTDTPSVNGFRQARTNQRSKPGSTQCWGESTIISQVKHHEQTFHKVSQSGPSRAGAGNGVVFERTYAGGWMKRPRKRRHRTRWIRKSHQWTCVSHPTSTKLTDPHVRISDGLNSCLATIEIVY